MTDIPILPLQLSALPDWAVLTDQQTGAALGISLDTLRRLDRAGDGPPRVELSPRRHGRPVGELGKWIQRRLGESFHGLQTQTRAERNVAGSSIGSQPKNEGRREGHRLSTTGAPDRKVIRPLNAQLDLFDTATVADPLTGLAAKLPETCGKCGHLVALVGPGKPPHRASLLCRSCGLHRGWISRATYTVLNEVISKFSVPTEPIVFRSRSSKPEENDDGISVVQDGTS